ncbi:MAG: glycine cleavage system protein H [Candidatus Korobacteraceae bacterium]
MSILFVLLTFLLVISITYFLRRPEQRAWAPLRGSEAWGGPPAPKMNLELGFEIPRGYCFHPGHMWVFDEGRQNTRVGIDAFTGKLLGKVDGIEIVGLNRWVRQGQTLVTIKREGLSFEMLSPIEGVITSVNHEVMKDPNRALADPYQGGWICVVKSPEVATNLRNLVQGPLVASWMQNSIARLSAMATRMAPALAQDGGLPIAGMMAQLDPGSQRRIIHEFFLT